MQGLQDTRLVPVRRDGSWIYALELQAAKGISGQVHHNEKDHWVTSIYALILRVYWCMTVR